VPPSHEGGASPECATCCRGSLFCCVSVIRCVCCSRSASQPFTHLPSCAPFPFAATVSACPPVVEKTLEKIRPCFDGRLDEDPLPLHFGDGGPGQMTFPEGEEEVRLTTRRHGKGPRVALLLQGVCMPLLDNCLKYLTKKIAPRPASSQKSDV